MWQLMKMKRNRFKLNLTMRNKARVLQILEKWENSEPLTTYHLHVFKTGIVVTSKQLRNVIIRVLRNSVK